MKGGTYLDCCCCCCRAAEDGAKIVRVEVLMEVVTMAAIDGGD